MIDAASRRVGERVVCNDHNNNNNSTIYFCCVITDYISVLMFVCSVRFS
jgi:hypothetical protein